MLTKTDIEKYFIAEKQGGLIFLIIGSIAVLAAICFLLFSKSNFLRGFAMPLILFGFIQVVVGFTIFKRSDDDRARIVYAFDMNPELIKNKELPRMGKVNRNFVIYKWFEIALILTGLILFYKLKDNVVYENSWKGNAFWYGLAIALILQGAIGLVADSFAEKRAKQYKIKLSEFVKK